MDYRFKTPFTKNNLDRDTCRIRPMIPFVRMRNETIEISGAIFDFMLLHYYWLRQIPPHKVISNYSFENCICLNFLSTFSFRLSYLQNIFRGTVCFMSVTFRNLVIGVLNYIQILYLHLPSIYIKIHSKTFRYANKVVMCIGFLHLSRLGGTTEITEWQWLLKSRLL